MISLFFEALLVFFLILVLVCSAGLIYQAIGARLDDRRFSPPGRLVDIGGRRMHLIETGQGSPTVVLESGVAASCLNWTEIRRRVSEFTRCVSYDRAGLGWSDAAAAPRVPSRIVEELHATLRAARIGPPYVLVGHSFGGLLVRAFAEKYSGEVWGVVLVDPLCAGDWINASGDQLRKLRTGVLLSRRGAVLAQLGIVRFALMLLAGGSHRLPQWVAKLSSGAGETTISRIVGEVRKMPPETWPAIQAHWCRPKSFLGMASYLESLPQSCEEGAALRLPPSVPVTILSAANSTAGERAERERIAGASSAGRQIMAADSGHWVHLDEPALVVEAIREMINRRAR